MALIFPDAMMLLEARRRGVCFNDTLTAAHLSLFLHPRELLRLRDSYRSLLPHTDGQDPLSDYQWGEESDRFLRGYLGVRTLDILDNSDYQRASLIHNLNLPVPPSHHRRYDAVIDAGTLEHVFHFTVALGNLMNMVKVGGSLFITTPANNMCGHGFYQFSPELFFRALCPENGFELRRTEFLECRFTSIELTPIRGAYQVTDPARVQKRVGLLSRQPVLMMIEAQRVNDSPPFATAPQQSDYVAMWKQAAPPQWRGFKGLARRIAQRLPTPFFRRIVGMYGNRIYSFSNKSFYRKL